MVSGNERENKSHQKQTRSAQSWVGQCLNRYLFPTTAGNYEFFKIT
jgi:hypothetical protein